MPRVSILLLVVCAGCLFEKSVGYNYYIQTGPGSPSLLPYPLISPYPALWDPNCDKKKGGGSSESSGEEGGSKEGSSAEEGKSKEGSSSEEGGESKEGSSSEGSKEEGGSKESEESGSNESGEKKEGSSEESGEKKREEKKKTKYFFPPLTYGFPPSQVKQILYSPVTSYSYVPPYKVSYVVQPPVASYPLKSSYRYVSVPAATGVVNGYSQPDWSTGARLVNSPITKIMYSSGLSYPQVPKTVVSPGANVYSIPGTWNGAYSYYKK